MASNPVKTAPLGNQGNVALDNLAGTIAGVMQRRLLREEVDAERQRRLQEIVAERMFRQGQLRTEINASMQRAQEDRAAAMQRAQEDRAAAMERLQAELRSREGIEAARRRQSADELALKRDEVNAIKSRNQSAAQNAARESQIDSLEFVIKERRQLLDQLLNSDAYLTGDEQVVARVQALAAEHDRYASQYSQITGIGVDPAGEFIRSQQEARQRQAQLDELLRQEQAQGERQEAKRAGAAAISDVDLGTGGIPNVRQQQGQGTGLSLSPEDFVRSVRGRGLHPKTRPQIEEENNIEQRRSAIEERMRRGQSGAQRMLPLRPSQRTLIDLITNQ